MRVSRVLETCLYVDDLELAERFYTAVLGLQVIAREPGRHCFFQGDNQVFLLFDPRRTVEDGNHHDVPRHGCRGVGHVAFTMAENEVEAWREQLARHGVAIERELTWENGGFSLYFRDPAGNSLELATPRLWGFDEPPR